MSDHDLNRSYVQATGDRRQATGDGDGDLGRGRIPGDGQSVAQVRAVECGQGRGNGQPAVGGNGHGVARERTEPIRARVPRIYYRKEKLRGACWEYQIDGGWLAVPTPAGERFVLHHKFSFYRPREIEVRTCNGVELLARTGAEQWFFPDRWFSLLRFVTEDDRTVGYYVNFSLPLAELRQNYYRDVDLELDLWLDPDGTATELDRDEFDAEIAQARMDPAWVAEVDAALERVTRAVMEAVRECGPDLDARREESAGVPLFILRA